VADHKRFLRQVLESYSKEMGFSLSDKADKVIDLIIAKDGNCPCRAIPVPCPCPFHVEEVDKDGQCHCNLFNRDWK
jgi:ferredoxin-thioredoxin reductase catalytic subunit